MSRYECEDCGLAAMDLPDGIDPEFIWLATTTPPPPALVGPSSTKAGREAARRLYEQIRNATEETAP